MQRAKNRIKSQRDGAGAGLFDLHELVFIIRDERRKRGLHVADKALDKALGVSAATIGRIRNRRQDIVHYGHTRDTLWSSASELSEFPWSQEVETQLCSMRQAIRDENTKPLDIFNRYRFSGQISVAVVCQCHKENRIDLSTEEVGHLLIAYHWLLSIAYESKSLQYRDNVEKIKLVEEFLDRYLRTIESSAWSRVLRFRLAQNAFGGQWSATRGEERKRFSRCVEDRDYIGCLLAYSEVLEGDKAALHNALAVASRLNKKEYFCQIGDRYSATEGHKTLEEFEQAITQEYAVRNADDGKDFEPFFDWARPRWEKFLNEAQPEIKDLEAFFCWVSSEQKPPKLELVRT